MTLIGDAGRCRSRGNISRLNRCVGFNEVWHADTLITELVHMPHLTAITDIKVEGES